LIVAAASAIGIYFLAVAAARLGTIFCIVMEGGNTADAFS
jgi:hypothetical protein